MRKKIIIACFVAIFCISTLGGSAKALDENTENELLENYQALVEDFQQYKQTVRENYVSIENYTNLLENYRTLKENHIQTKQDLSTLENSIYASLENQTAEIEDLVTERIETMNQSLNSRFENQQQTIDVLISEWETEKKNFITENVFENRTEKIKQNFGSKYYSLDDRLEKEEKDEKGKWALGIGLLAIVTLAGFYYGATTGKFSFTETPNKDYDIDDMINEEENRLDYMIENNYNTPEIVSQAKKLEEYKIAKQIKNGEYSEDVLEEIPDPIAKTIQESEKDEEENDSEESTYGFRDKMPFG